MYVTRNTNNRIQQIIASNLKQDSTHKFSFSEKLVVTQSQTSQLTAPKIENFIGTPVVVWAEKANNLATIKYAVILDSLANKPQIIQDGLPLNTTFLFYSKDKLKENDRYELENALFFTNGKDLYQAVLDSSFQFGTSQKIFTADSLIKQLDFARSITGSSWLVFLSGLSLKTLVKTGQNDPWQGPFLLTRVANDSVRFKITIGDQASSTYNSMTFAWTDHRIFYSSLLSFQGDSVKIEPEYTYDFSANFDRFDFTMNTFVFFECAEVPKNKYFCALQSSNSWYLRPYLDYGPVWAGDFKSPFAIKRLRISGNEQDLFVYVWEVLGPNGSDLYGAFDLIPSGLEHNSSTIPTSLRLFANYPNPFNAQTTIPFYLPEAAKVEVDLLNIRGQKIQRLFYGALKAGRHTLTLNGQNLASGVYFIRLRTEKVQQIRKCVLLK